MMAKKRLLKKKNEIKEKEKDVEVIELGGGMAIERERDQEIIEVDQDTLKKSLQVLLTKENDFLAFLYTKWTEYNEQYFFGELSYPLITFDKMDNRTLGNYTYGEDSLGITNHIRFNRHFISLNTEERILETLRHEMIHQWQDEILYAQDGQKTLKSIRIQQVNEEGHVETVETMQKKRPKDWHNKDFKDFAQVVGIPATGEKCYGNPAKMPEPKSYNRKFVCSCIASNGYPVTIWCTRSINVQCMTCGKPYIEVPKGGKVIKVEQSHIEKPGEDAVEIAHKAKYKHFGRFESKTTKDEFMGKLKEAEGSLKGVVEGVYQKNHNMYKAGYTHWVAYNASEIKPPTAKPVEKKLPKSPPTKKKEPSKEPEDDSNVIVLPFVEAPVIEETPVEVEQVVEPKERSHTNPQDLLDIYKEKGSIKGVAEFFNMTSPAIIYQAKKTGVDFKKGVITNGSDK